jgi:hypothetical protein
MSGVGEKGIKRYCTVDLACSAGRETRIAKQLRDETLRTSGSAKQCTASNISIEPPVEMIRSIASTDTADVGEPNDHQLNYQNLDVQSSSLDEDS